MKADAFPCVRCGKFIACTSKDPVISTRSGNMHYGCFKGSVGDDTQQEEERRETIRQRRSDGQKKRTGMLEPGSQLKIRPNRLEQYTFLDGTITEESVLTLDRISGLKLICAFNGSKIPVQRSHVLAVGD